MPPFIASVHVHESGRTRFRIWLPVFLVWPLVYLLMLILLPLIVAADLILTAAGKQLSLTGIVFAVHRVLAALRGLRVHVSSGGGTSGVHVVLE
jgi:hypothetical protein